MSNNDLVNTLANALGSPHFNPDQVIEVLAGWRYLVPGVVHEALTVVAEY